MDIVSLFFLGELVAGVDHLAVIPLSVLNVLGGAHNGNVYLSAASDDVVPVNKVDVSKQTAVNGSVLDGHSLASSEEYGTQMTVGVHA